MRRQVAVEFAALAPDHVVDAVAQRLELRAAVVDHPVTAFEAEREAGVHQLDQVEVAARILERLVEQQEELLAAETFLVQA